MPILAALLVSGFTGIITFFTTYLGKKAATGVATGVFLAAGWVAVQGCQLAIWTATASSLGALMSPFLLKCLSVVAYLLPLQFNTFLQAIIAGKFCRWVLDRHREWVKATAAS